jgi:hypothetical protein
MGLLSGFSLACLICDQRKIPLHHFTIGIQKPGICTDPGDHKLGRQPEFVTDLWTLKKKSPHTTAYTICIFSLSFFPFPFPPFLLSFPPFLSSFPPFLLFFFFLSPLLFLSFPPIVLQFPQDLDLRLS